MNDQTRKLAQKCGMLEASLEIMLTRLQVELAHPNPDSTIMIGESIKYIENQLKKAGE